jgi:hypothetical protein
MNTQERILQTIQLERVSDGTDSGWGNGNEVLEISIDYRKDARPRGYYLRVQTFRRLDNGGIQMDIFGHPRKVILLQETKAFSAKVLAGITCDQALLDATIAAVKAAHLAYRAKQKEEARLATA